MSTSLTVDYGDGSQKRFSFDEAKSLSELFQLAKTTTAGLQTTVWPDRGEKRILAFEIDGHGHPNPGTWALTRNRVAFWPDMNEFTAGPLEDGDALVFTLKQDR
ncbi:MAG: hypothetical protein AB7G75_08045 [Candidatus Binatia bacterium]